jgi:hypothetical protein
MGNEFAHIILLLWPFITMGLFAIRSAYIATYISLVGGYLLLPEGVGFDFPLVPELNKHSIPVLSILLAFIVIKRRWLSLLPKDKIHRLFIVLFIFAPVFAFWGNRDPVFNGAYMFPGISFYDVVSLSIEQALFILPFIVGYHMCQRPEDLTRLLKLLVFTILLYTLPMLLEIRLSPQLHNWVYGFFPHSFGQQIRGGGFRPVVFLEHGLLVANLLSFGIAFLAVLTRLKIRIIGRVPNLVILLFMLFTLVLCKSLAALIFTIFMLLLILFVPLSLVRATTIMLALVFALYPLLIISDLFPTKEIVDMFSSFSADRAQSLEFRFSNEAALIENAKTKVFFGWNGWGRYRLADSTTDSYWIILFGQYGLFGFLTFFSLILWPIVRGRKIVKRLPSGSLKTLMFLMPFVILVFMLDLLINSPLKSWALFFIGAYAGFMHRLILRLTRSPLRSVSRVSKLGMNK